MALLATLKGLMNGGKIVESVGAVIDNLVTSKEEKELLKIELTKEINRHSEAVESEIAKVYEAELKDTQSARDSNARIQESDKASWLAKNVGYCIDIFLIIVFCGMLLIIIYKVVPELNKELFYTSFGLLGSYVGQSISFHRGTSAGSHAKQQQINKMANKD